MTWTAIPFVLLLLAIAILPLAAPHFWESNKNKGIIAVILSIPTIFFMMTSEPHAIFHTLKEYFSFICLLGSLYVISGGVAVVGDLKATPLTNTVFLAIGSVLANIIGTTGASMLLIRPLLRTNSKRKKTRHIPVFFIFTVANCGGLLTPLGDPPLFLGYLRGVPFFWTMRLFPFWLVMMGLLLTIFYLWDKSAYRHETEASLSKDAAEIEPIKINGVINIIFLFGMLCSVFLPTPWREILMIFMAIASLRASPKSARHINQFTWGPIVEVAVIFAGIFITMVPALMLLKTHAPSFGITGPLEFFWLTGILSSFLDNAPTYLTFLSIAQGLGLAKEVVMVPANLLAAISMGAVFMGANTYIGNGPNFMIKAIADHTGFKTPSFFGYMLYSVGILFPIYIIISLFCL